MRLTINYYLFVLNWFYSKYHGRIWYLHSRYLENAIKQIKSQPSTIANEVTAVPSASFPSFSSSIRAASTERTMNLSESVSVSSYILEFDVTGKYVNKTWSGVGGSSVGIDSDQFAIVYKISSKSLNTTFSSVIVLNATVRVDSYVGIGDVGLIKVLEKYRIYVIIILVNIFFYK